MSRTMRQLCAVGVLGAAVLGVTLLVAPATSDRRFGSQSAPVPEPRAPSLGAGGGSQTLDYRQTSFGGPRFNTGATRVPTADATQSKLWFHDGSWWGVLLEAESAEFRIHELDWSAQTWTDTGTLVDERAFVRADVLWDGTHLYVVSGGSRPRDGHATHLLRFSYDGAARAYTRDEGFPVTLAEQGVSAANVAKDTTGTLWVAYLSGEQIKVARTVGDDTDWGSAFEPPVDGASAPVHRMVLVAFGESVAVLWINQGEDALHIATHADDGWESSVTSMKGLGEAESELHAPAIQAADRGRVFAAVRLAPDEAVGTSEGAPRILLLALESNGIWRKYLVSEASERHVQPLLLIDENNDDLYVFSLSRSDTAVYYKRSSLKRLSFNTGPGTPFFAADDGGRIRTRTSTKNAVDARNGIVVLAVDDRAGRYLHGAMGAENDTPASTQGAGLDSGSVTLMRR